jgi:hypothetical protein
LIFVASAYSHADPAVMQARFEQVEHGISRWLRRNFPVFSPIVYCHRITHKYTMPKDAAWWKAMNDSWLLSSEQLWVATWVDGWEESEGVDGEIVLAAVNNIPISYKEMPDVGT